jgi:hypothetical protein
MKETGRSRRHNIKIEWKFKERWKENGAAKKII